MCTRTSYFRVQMESPGFTAVLGSAVLEWLLIILLFMDASFSYLVTKFAHFCKLQTPCLLCSRLDHVLGNQKPGFYKDLICKSHKLEISSLVFCNTHNKLADVHGLCEGCLFSFATEKKSNSETCRLLVGTLGIDLECRANQDQLLEETKVDSSSERKCTCCKEPWSSRSYTHSFLQTKSVEHEMAELDDPLLGSMGTSRMHLGDGLKKRTEETSHLVPSSSVRSNGFDPLSRVGYTELKITSDSDSEVQFSDDDGGSPLVREIDGLKEEVVVQCNEQEPQTSSPENLLEILSNDLAPEKQIYQDSMPESSLLFPHVHLDVEKPRDETSLASAIAIGHGLEELNWQEEQKSNPSAPPELVSQRDIPASTDIEEALVDVSENTLDVIGDGKSEEDFKSDSGLTTTTEPGLKKDLVLNINIPPMPNLMDLSDAYKLAIGNRSPVVGLFGEQLSAKSSLRDKDDTKLLLSQISATRGLDSPLNGMSPRVHGLGEELKISDASSSVGLQILQKRISLERNESGLSLDGSLVSEIEGESVIDRLRRQVEYDRKSMNALYKDLEEERNASAVAANQAMAMITRLQEEKATLHMEALQYLRMMEEQSEYDVEALQKANDLLVEKEKEIQDMEAELEVYKKKFQSVFSDKIEEAVCNSNGRDMRVENSDERSIEYDTNVSCSSPPGKKSQDDNKPENNDMMYGGKQNISKDSLLDFEDERLYISQCLEKLERKLHLFSNYGVDEDVPNGEYSGKEQRSLDNLERLHCSESMQESNQVEEDGFSGQKDSSLSRGHSQEMSTPLVGNPLVDSNERHEATMTKETDLLALENEIFDLNERLKALEADRNFLEHTMNSLRNGDDGIKFIQQIANHLQELRRIGIRREQASL